uniref:Uncharacterized protein n=1 Tax=Anguilla anguilla TaxID=7936 RepID=A0A0E9XQW3_ANGAN
MLKLVGQFFQPQCLWRHFMFSPTLYALMTGKQGRVDRSVTNLHRSRLNEELIPTGT